MSILEINNVTKQFGGLMALDDVSFQVEEGEIRGLIGPNGSRQKHHVQEHRRFSGSNQRAALATREKTLKVKKHM